jgi:hypothetical protein
MRHVLVRSWDDVGPRAVIAMLNPSIADGDRDDATVCRLTSIYRRFGFAGYDVWNLCPYVATDQRTLYAWLAGPDGGSGAWVAPNLRALDGLLRARPGHLLLAHGNVRGHALVEVARRARALAGRHRVPIAALGLTRHGCPRHPLARVRDPAGVADLVTLS